MNAKEQWKCPHCGTLCETHGEAEVCCKEPVRRVYICGDCEEEHDSESDAIACCDDSGNDICTCSHRRSSHSDDGECEVFINEFFGDCPCVEFDKVDDV